MNMLLFQRTTIVHCSFRGSCSFNKQWTWTLHDTYLGQGSHHTSHKQNNPTPASLGVILPEQHTALQLDRSSGIFKECPPCPRTSTGVPSGPPGSSPGSPPLHAPKQYWALCHHHTSGIVVSVVCTVASLFCVPVVAVEACLWWCDILLLGLYTHH